MQAPDPWAGLGAPPDANQAPPDIASCSREVQRSSHEHTTSRAPDRARRAAVLCPDPQFASLAHIEDRWTLESTDGPVDMVKVRCSAGCWYTVLADDLSPATDR